jgi:hypothetical protein
VVVQFKAQCNADKYFAYCTERGVGTKNPKGNRVTRWLDKLVAAKAGYLKNRLLLDQATEDVAQWQAHQKLLRDELTTAVAAAESALETSLKAGDGVRLEEACDATSLTLNGAQLTVSQLNSKVTALVSQKNLFDQEQDPQAVEIRSKLTKAVEAASGVDLLSAVSETTSSDDDAAATDAATYRELILQLQKKMDDASEAAQASSLALGRITDLRNNFVANGYDSSYSQFQHGLDGDSLIAGVLLGNLSSSSAMGQFQTSYHDATPAPSDDSSSSSSSSSSDNSFSSGGSFGGGGGFDTGGSF